ncbi:CAAX prenyl protease 1 [Penicillium atrosanguineum]|uniref:CAAX prenyl protease 1 n=1 Tax=Penicillium atrosanguineum TaxID=1132637 RepID=UPI00238E3334|nr:CAAX prenyl protease 1 [Penicillium atrosanguineum]KAJ5305185.1 CAAX prenyl protease 1 [Penicillium atrosanguineum]
MTRHPKQSSATLTVTATTVSRSTEPEPQDDNTPHPHLRIDGSPLIGLPNNPDPLQRPHARARDVLAYHQFLFRTMPNIFPPESLSFWRDYICQEAWEVEYVFDAIVALGSMHRATLLLSQQSENDRHRGLDTKVIAIRAYANALQGVSDNLACDQIPMALLLGVLILFAYVECFDGNVPATMRHIHMAQYYSRAMCSKNTQESERFKKPIELCLQDLDLLRRVTLPDPKVIKMIYPLYRQGQSPSLSLSSSQASLDPSPRLMLQQLLDIGSMDAEIKQLTWCAIGVNLRQLPESKLLAISERLKSWKDAYAVLFHRYEVDEALSDPVNFNFAALDKLSMPPAPHLLLPKDYCLTLALYSFYRARLLWALSIHNHGEGNLELDAYHFIYQFLRFVKTATDTPPTNSQDSPLGCEALRIGFSPMLFLAAQSCAKPAWLRWISFELARVGQEGVFNNKAFASSLDVLSTLETRVNRNAGQTGIEHFSSPTSRVLSIIFPDMDGRAYVTYYGQVSDRDADGGSLYSPLCIARWSASVNGGRPVVDTFDGAQETVYSEWVLHQNLVREWVQWLTFSEFDLNQTLHDHMSGSRLLPNRDEMDW